MTRDRPVATDPSTTAANRQAMGARRMANPRKNAKDDHKAVALSVTDGHRARANPLPADAPNAMDGQHVTDDHLVVNTAANALSTRGGHHATTRPNALSGRSGANGPSAAIKRSTSNAR